MSVESEKKPTLHHVWPFQVKIKKYLSNIPNENNLLSQMKRAGLQYMQKNETQFAMTKEHKIATFLHPYMKGLKFAPFAESVNVRGIVQKEIDSILASSRSDNAFESNANGSRSHIPLAPSLYDDIIDSTIETQENRDEINNYLVFNPIGVSRKKKSKSSSFYQYVIYFCEIVGDN